MSHLQWRYSLLEQYFDILRDFRVLYIAVSFLQQKLYIGGFDVTAPSVFLSKDEDIDYFKLYIAETGLTFPF